MRNCVREIKSCDYCRKQHHNINRYIFVKYQVIVARAQIDKSLNFATISCN